MADPSQKRLVKGQRCHDRSEDARTAADADDARGHDAGSSTDLESARPTVDQELLNARARREVSGPGAQLGELTAVDGHRRAQLGGESRVDAALFGPLRDRAESPEGRRKWQGRKQQEIDRQSYLEARTHRVSGHLLSPVDVGSSPARHEPAAGGGAPAQTAPVGWREDVPLRAPFTMKRCAAWPRWTAPGRVLGSARIYIDTDAPCVLARNRPAHPGDEAPS